MKMAISMAATAAAIVAATLVAAEALRWDSVAQADLYKVYHARAMDGPYTNVASTVTNVFPLPLLPPGPHFFYVTAASSNYYTFSTTNMVVTTNGVTTTNLVITSTNVFALPTPREGPPSDRLLTYQPGLIEVLSLK